MTALAGRVIRDGAALEALVQRWWDLWRRCPAATPFQSPAWLVPWWREFAPGDLFVLAVETRDTLVGLAPFFREEGPHGRRLLPLGIAVSDYLDVLLAPEAASAAWDIMVELARQEPRWDVWEFEELMPGAAASSLPCPSDWREDCTNQSACPTLTLATEDLVRTLPRRKRYQLNLARNRAARRFATTVHRSDPSSVRESLEHLFHLHDLRWASRGETGVLRDEAVLRFHRAAAPALAQAGLLWLDTLALDGTVAAAQYGFRHRDRVYYYLSGLDPAYAFESPGVLLLAYTLEEAAREGVRELHFLRGQETYKYGWGAVDRWNRRRSFRRGWAQHAT